MLTNRIAKHPHPQINALLYIHTYILILRYGYKTHSYAAIKKKSGEQPALAALNLFNWRVDDKPAAYTLNVIIIICTRVYQQLIWPFDAGVLACVDTAQVSHMN